MVHAETSTGVCQPMEGIGDLCRQHDCLLLLDTVTSLGAVPLTWMTGRLTSPTAAARKD